MNLVCRIQDREGRGPYRPGFSRVWSERQDGPASVFVAFPGILAKVRQVIDAKGGAVGCAFRTIKQASNWFSPSEVLTLAKLGYSLCWVIPDEVLAENEDQLVIWTAQPLADSVIATGWKLPTQETIARVEKLKCRMNKTEEVNNVR